MLFSIFGISVIAVLISLTLKKHNPEFALIIALLAGVLLFGFVLLQLSPILDSIHKIMDGAQLQTDYLAVIIKALGICYVTQLAADTCKDAGYSAIASKVELAGKVSILLIALPLFENLIGIVQQLMTIGT